MTDAPAQRRSGCSPTRSTAPRPTYDAMVALSPGYHDQLRTAAEALVDRLPGPRHRRRRAAGARPRLRLRRLDPRCARRLVGARRARSTACRSPASTPRRAWSRRPARSAWPPSVDAGRLAMPSPTSSRCRAARSTACWPRYLLRNVPDRARLVRRGGPRAAPRRRRSSSTTTPSPGTPAPEATWDGGVPRHHHPAGGGEALRRAAAPLPLHERARLRLGRPHLRAAAVESVSSTSGTGPTPGGSTASCTPSPGRHRRDRPQPRAGPRGSTAGRCSTRHPRRCRPRRMPRAVPASARHVVVVGGGIAGLDRGAGPRRARRAGHRARARGAARRAGAVVAGRAARRRARPDEPRLPRVLPAVLQPARRAAPHRPDPRAAAPARRLPARARRRRRATRSRTSRARRRGTSPRSSPAARASTSQGWPPSTSTPRWGCSTSTSRRRSPPSTASAPPTCSTGCASPRRPGTWRSRCSRAASSPTHASSPAPSSSRCSTCTSSARPRGCSSTCRATTTTRTLWAPLGAHLHRLGVTVVTGREVRSVAELGEGISVLHGAARPRRPGLARRRTPSCSPSTRSACAGSSPPPPGSGATTRRCGVAGGRGRHPVGAARSRSGGCGCPGRVAPERPAVPRHERLRAARQRLGARAVRGPRDPVDARPRRLGRRAARLRPARGHRRGRPAPAAARRAAPGLPRDGGLDVVHDEWLVERRLRARRARAVAVAPGRAHPRPAGACSPATPCGATCRSRSWSARRRPAGWRPTSCSRGWGLRGHGVWSVPMGSRLGPAAAARAPRHPAPTASAVAAARRSS